jgi:hypothetical protein
MVDVVALKEAGEAVIKQSKIVREAVLANQKEMWCFVPSLNPPVSSRVEDTQPTQADFTVLASTLSNVWMGEEPEKNHLGLLVCGVDEVLDEIQVLNEAKLRLIEATDAVKKVLHTQQALEINPRADEAFVEAMGKAWKEFINKNRDFEFHTLLKRLQLPEMNFKKARKLVRVLEPEVLRVGYTWSKNPYRKSKIDAKAIAALSEYYQQMGKAFRAEKVREALAEYRDVGLYRVTFGKPVPRINFKYRTEMDAKPVWSNCLATGITVVAQSEVPIVVWKPKPTDEEVEETKRAWLKKVRLKPVQLDSVTELYINAK